MFIFVEMFGKFLKFKRKGGLERFIEGERAATRRNKEPSLVELLKLKQ